MDHRGKTHTGLRVATFFVGFFLPVFTWGWGCIPELNWGGFSKNSQWDPPLSSQKVIKGPKEPEEVGGGFTLLFLFFFFFSFTPFFLPSHWGHPIRRASSSTQISNPFFFCFAATSLYIFFLMGYLPARSNSYAIILQSPDCGSLVVPGSPNSKLCLWLSIF